MWTIFSASGNLLFNRNIFEILKSFLTFCFLLGGSEFCFWRMKFDPCLLDPDVCCLALPSPKSRPPDPEDDDEVRELLDTLLLVSLVEGNPTCVDDLEEDEEADPFADFSPTTLGPLFIKAKPSFFEEPEDDGELCCCWTCWLFELVFWASLNLLEFDAAKPVMLPVFLVHCFTAATISAALSLAGSGEPFETEPWEEPSESSSFSFAWIISILPSMCPLEPLLERFIFILRLLSVAGIVSVRVATEPEFPDWRFKETVPAKKTF